ncbi:hypothetical protein PRZ48_008635 [Zasmidium cellare]|uniref:Uncharacterized protein n=1 Tax=Zasmidium cellare TaxID=395010 RepID=A0ABR0EG06_ZASCE|nr:hypothetical protein PRZ48_008635 [Zasmidium cellare]
MPDKVLVAIFLPHDLVVALRDNKVRPLLESLDTTPILSTIFDAVEDGAKAEGARTEKIIETRSEVGVESSSSQDGAKSSAATLAGYPGQTGDHDGNDVIDRLAVSSTDNGRDAEHLTSDLDQTGLLARRHILPLNETQHIIDRSGLSQEMVDMTMDNPGVGDETLSAVYRDLRGRDRPSDVHFAAPVPGLKRSDNASMSNDKISKSRRVQKRAAARARKDAMGDDDAVYIRADKHQACVSLQFPKMLRSDGLAFVGHCGPTSTGKVIIRFTPVMSSQVPACILSIKAAGDGDNLPFGINKVEVHVYANCLARHPTSHGAQAGLSMRTTFTGDLPHHPNISAGDEESDGLSQISLNLNPPDSVTSGQHDESPRPCRPVFSGIAEDQLRDLQRRANGLKPGDEGLSHFEWILVALFSQSELDIIRFWPNSAECNAAFLRFESFWGAALKDAAATGSFPYYRRLAASQGVSIDSPNFRHHLAIPPPHIITKWRLTYRDGSVVAIVPEKWEDLPLMGLSYPDAETAALAARIRLERNGGLNTAV